VGWEGSVAPSGCLFIGPVGSVVLLGSERRLHATPLSRSLEALRDLFEPTIDSSSKSSNSKVPAFETDHTNPLRLSCPAFADQLYYPCVK